MDFQADGEMPLTLARTYNYYWAYRGLFGKFWVSSFDYSLVWQNNDGLIYAQRPDGRRIKFIRVGTTDRWNEDKPQPVAYILKNGDGSYTHYSENLPLEVYRDDGRPLSIKNLQGIGWSYSYGTGDSTNYPVQVTHTSGRFVKFTWSFSSAAGGATGGYLSSVQAPDGSVFTYTYLLNAYGTGGHQLRDVTGPAESGGNDATKVAYYFEDAAKPGALTGKAYQGVRYSTFAYDAQGRANLSQHHGPSGTIVDKYTFVYNGTVTPPANPPPPPLPPGQSCPQHQCVTPIAPQGETDPELARRAALAAAEDANLSAVVANTSVVETNPLGRTTTYTFGTNGRLVSTSEAASANCPARAASRTYDTNGYDDKVTDFKGNVTDYDYNAKGQLTQKVEASGTSVARTTTYGWDATYNRMTRETVVGDHETTWTYGSDHRLASIKIKNLSANGTANETRTWSYVYTKYASGLVQTMVEDGPLSGTQDQITYGYTSFGDLNSIRNILGQVTTRSIFTGLGQPMLVRGPNGDDTTYVYYPGGRLKQVVTYPNGADLSATAFTYSAGLLATSTAPDGTKTTFTYDSARRLTNASRPEIGGTAERRWFYNANGNPIRAEIYRGSTLRHRAYADYDELGRVLARRGNNSQNVRFAYDANGNVRTVTDSLNRVTTLTYDALNRVASSKDPKNGLTQFQYDKGDRTTKVIDPRSLSTTYVLDGFGQLWKETSPDRGVTSQVWNASGQRTSMTRANYETTTFTYNDGLGRLTMVKAGSVSQLYGYDGCTNGKGRLCTAELSGGSTPNTMQYQYEPDGRLRQRRDLSTIAGVQTDITTTHGYDAYGRLSQLTYPNGEVATYAYASGQPSGLTIKVGSLTFPVVSSPSYEPMGPATGWTYGNGLTSSRSFDLDRRLTSLSTNNGTTKLQGLGYGYNANDLATSITNSVDSAQSRSHGYDELSRLTGYVYDANGNRLSGSDGSTYTIASTSNRLTATNVLGPPSTLTPDGMGNVVNYAVTGVGNVAYGYDSFNRMSTVSVNGTQAGSYGYAASGDRIGKTAGGVRTRFVSTNDHTLLAEKADSSSLWTNYLWFNGELVGMTRGGVRYAIHNDHLGRPEMATSVGKAIVWKSNNGTFGGQSVVTNTIGGLNVGFPGQYFDAESGLWYNVNRYYDPHIGRYYQVDPIGLGSGVNTYAYTFGNPVSLIDPLGLEGTGYWNNGGIRNAPDIRAPDFFQASIDLYVFNANGTFSRSGNSFFGFGITRQYPNVAGLGVSITGGWLNQCEKPSGQQTDDFIGGFGQGFSAFYGAGGGLLGSPGNGTATVIGFGMGWGGGPAGGGFAPGGVSYLQGPTGLGGW